MNINFGATTNNTITDPTLTQSSSSNRAAASHAPSHGDAAIVSLGGSVDELQKQLAAMPEVQSDRIQQLQAAVEQGTYNVSPANVASAMLATLFGEG